MVFEEGNEITEDSIAKSSENYISVKLGYLCLWIPTDSWMLFKINYLQL